MKTRTRWTVAFGALLTTGLLTAGFLTGGTPAPQALPRSAGTALLGETAGPEALANAIGRYQQRLKDLPADHQTWAALGSAYVQQARITLDPAYYGKAEGALRRSLSLEGKDNFAAMTGLGTLANARHDFAEALRWGEQAERVNPYSAEVHGVLADAHTQLGNTSRATAAIKSMIRLEPGVPSYTRASYDAEQRGDLPAARRDLTRALAAAYSTSDRAFCRYHLGELALHSGDLAGARREFGKGLAELPNDPNLLAGRARVAVRSGDTAAAERDYQTLIERTPQPQYVAEYGELLAAEGRPADRQWALLRTLRSVQQQGGVRDDLTWAEFEADHGNPAEAVRLAESEWDRRRTVPVADALAWALHKNGDDERALHYARLATRTGWRNALLHHHKAVIEESLGRRSDRDHVRRIDPNFDPNQPAQGRPA